MSEDKVTAVQPGTFSDGQHRDGITTANIHRDRAPAYDSAEAIRYRQDLGERPSASRLGK